MKVGLIADTHDNLDYLDKAVNIFHSQGVSVIVHAGDYVAPFVFRILDRFEGKFYGVFGNNDGEILGLLSKSGQRIVQPPLRIELDGKKVLVVHDPVFVDEIAANQSVDIIVHGHTHEKRVDKIGKTLIVNPGECGGWLGGKATAAILETGDLSVEIVNL
ncbi:MAG: metallophosphoesterase [Candidatus Theseobacter exili]|nr:metallophosphoesterase [Candidatus Theseobacter exili]